MLAPASTQLSFEPTRFAVSHRVHDSPKKNGTLPSSSATFTNMRYFPRSATRSSGRSRTRVYPTATAPSLVERRKAGLWQAATNARSKDGARTATRAMASARESFIRPSLFVSACMVLTMLGFAGARNTLYPRSRNLLGLLLPVSSVSTPARAVELRCEERQCGAFADQSDTRPTADKSRVMRGPNGRSLIMPRTLQRYTKTVKAVIAPTMMTVVTNPRGTRYECETQPARPATSTDGRARQSQGSISEPMTDVPVIPVIAVSRWMPTGMLVPRALSAVAIATPERLNQWPRMSARTMCTTPLTSVMTPTWTLLPRTAAGVHSA